MIRLTDIVDKVLSYNPDANLDLIHKAYVYSAKVHHGQIRKSGEPYLIHPLEVAGILADLQLDEESIATGLLHDVIEDTVTTPEQLKELFGEQVAFLVDGVSKISRVTVIDAARQKAESFRKMIVAIARDPRVILVKLADRLHNMRTLKHLSAERQYHIAKETLDIYAPIANRLGIGGVKGELEDLCLKYLFPVRFGEITKQLEEKVKIRERYIDTVIDILKKEVGDYGISAEVSGRIKHVYSIFKKMEKQNIDFNHVYDIIAFRILVGTIRDCYEVLGVVHNSWKPVPGRFKDYIAMPKANRYQSLHTTVIGPEGEMMEIQIRTEEMHRIADLGVAAHWRYKDEEEGDVRSEKAFNWLRHIVDLQKDTSDPAEFITGVKEELFPEEVLVFSPKGDVIELKRGSTPVDYAYAIHTEVGNKCVGAKVNGKMVPLREHLKNGDMVEIITNPNHQPSKDWLKFVKTNKAISRIRAYTRLQEKERSLELGKQIVEKAIRKQGLAMHKLMKNEGFQTFLKEQKYRSSDDYFSSVAYGRSQMSVMMRYLFPETAGKEEKKKKQKKLNVGDFIRKVAGKESPPIIVKGVDDVLIRFGKCCNPLPGDSITGFVTRGRGITIHGADCSKILEADPARKVDVTWDEGSKASRPAKIKVVCVDKPGLLANISKAITAMDVDIRRAMVVTTKDERAVCDFEIAVQNVSHLTKVIKSITKINNVITVDRMKS